MQYQISESHYFIYIYFEDFFFILTTLPTKVSIHQFPTSFCSPWLSFVPLLKIWWKSLFPFLPKYNFSYGSKTFGELNPSKAYFRSNSECPPSEIDNIKGPRSATYKIVQPIYLEFKNLTEVIELISQKMCLRLNCLMVQSHIIFVYLYAHVFKQIQML